MGGDVLDFIAPVAGFALGGPLGAAAASGITTGIRTGNPLAGALSAGGSLAGGALGGSIIGQTPAHAIGNAIGGEALGSAAPFGSFAGNILGSQSIGSMAGSALGSNLGGKLGARIMPIGATPENPSGLSAPKPIFTPSRQSQMGLPQSLSQFGSLTPQQQESGIATRGVYGQGNGPEENHYFLNLVNRSLVDNAGNVGNTNGMAPVNKAYLDQLGLGGYGNTKGLLQNISRYQG